LLADPVSKTEAALAQRVARAGARLCQLPRHRKGADQYRDRSPPCYDDPSVLAALRDPSETNERRDREEPATMAVKLSGNGNKSYLQLDGDLGLVEGKPRSRGK